jgi:hypothetical protein
MRNKIVKTIAIGALSLFLAGKSVSALTPENVSEIKTAFEFGKKSYLVLQDGTITPAKEEGKIILNNNKWVSDKGAVMPNEFQGEVSKVLKLASEKEKKGMKLIDFFEYTNAKGEKNCFNFWSDGTMSFGPYNIVGEQKLFFDSNKDGKFSKGDEYMKGAFNTQANGRIIVALSELAVLREKETNYQNMIKNLESTIAENKNKAEFDNLTLVKELEDTKLEYTSKVADLNSQIAGLNSQIASFNEEAKNNKPSKLEKKAEESNSIDMSKEGLKYSLKGSEKTEMKDSVIEMNNSKEDKKSDNVYDSHTSPIQGKVIEPILTEENFNESHTPLVSWIPEPITLPQPKANPNKGLTLTLDGELGFNDSANAVKRYGGELGLRYDFNNDFGMGIKLGVGDSIGNELISSYEGTPSQLTGRKFKGITTREDILRFKASLEARLGVLIVEGGAVYIPMIEKSIGQIIGRNGDVLKENSSSINKSQIDYFGGLGIEAGALRILIGGESEKGMYAKLGFKIHFPKN